MNQAFEFECQSEDERLLRVEQSPGARFVSLSLWRKTHDGLIKVGEICLGQDDFRDLACLQYRLDWRHPAVAGEALPKPETVLPLAA